MDEWSKIKETIHYNPLSLKRMRKKKICQYIWCTKNKLYFKYKSEWLYLRSRIIFYMRRCSIELCAYWRLIENDVKWLNTIIHYSLHKNECCMRTKYSYTFCRNRTFLNRKLLQMAPSHLLMSISRISL